MGCSEIAVREGAAIALVAVVGKEEAGVFEPDEELTAGGRRLGRPVALLTVSVAAFALAVLPAAVGVTILFGSTVPLGFAAAVCLALLASIKIGAGVAGVAAATGARIGLPAIHHLTLATPGAPAQRR